MSTASSPNSTGAPGWPVLGKLVDSLKDLKGFMRFCGILALGMLVIIGILGGVGFGSDWPTGLVLVLSSLTAAFLVFGLASLGCVRLALSLEYGAPVALENAQQKQELDSFAVRLISFEALTEDRIRGHPF